MSAVLSILQARAQLTRFASAHPLRLSYARDHGLALPRLGDRDPIARACGILAIAPIRLAGRGRFDFAEPGAVDAFPAAVVEGFGRDGRTTVDLVAWPLNRPAGMLTMFGAVSMLGLAEIGSAVTYAFGPLRVWRTPLRWLQEGGRGAVVIDPPAAARDLLDATERGTVSGEDREHSEELARLVASLFDARRFVAPRAPSLQDAA